MYVSHTYIGNYPQQASSGAAVASLAGQAAAAADLGHQWTIMAFLPPACQPHFMHCVTEFLYLPWVQHGQEGGSEEAPAAAQVAWLRGALPQRITPALLRVVGDLWRHVSELDDDPAHRFPKLPGSHLTEVGCVLCAMCVVDGESMWVLDCI